MTQSVLFVCEHQQSQMQHGAGKWTKTQGSCLANQICLTSHLALNSVWELYCTCKSAYYYNILPSVCDEAVNAIFKKYKW